MTDREKVIKGLECCKPAWFTITNCADDYCPYNCYGHSAVTGCVDHLIDDALEMLKEQEFAKDTNVPNNGWISVKDRMPDEGVWVLVWEKQGFAYADKLVSGVWQIGGDNGAIITHWMPLPKPPEEDKNVD